MVALTASWVVLDIEGTTSSTSSVHVGLYAYARPRLGPWIAANADDPEVRGAVALVREKAGLPAEAPVADVVAVLHGWMDGDVKATPLKTLQGQIWAAGFAAGELTAHFFPDVPPALRSWRERGLRLAVFSSGAVSSQRPWFAHSDAGDLSVLIERHFDTVNAGPKKEPDSYRRIAGALGEPPDRLLFLSDVPAELDAAAAAGWTAVGVRRPGEPSQDAGFGAHPVIATFAELTPPDRPAAGRVLAAGGRLARESARFAGFGWMRGTSGNLSEVLSRDPLRLVVTASGLDKGELAPADVAVVDEAGAPVAVEGVAPRRPSAEAGLHARVAAVTGAGAVVHVHALSAVVAGRRWPGGVRLRDVETLKGIGRAAHDDEVIIPVIRNSQDMAELGDRFEAGYDPRTPALIVASHGLYAWGTDLLHARHVTECVEWLLSYAVATS